MARLWQVMQARLGNWVTHYGPLYVGTDVSDTVRCWAEDLADLSGDELRQGITACRDWTENFPPTLGQFRRLCRPSAVGRSGSHEIYQALPKPVPDPDLTREAIGRMQQAQSGGKGGRRCIYSPGYGPDEYAAAIRAAKAEGKRLYDVDMAAMARNGWTEDDESRIRANMLTTGIPLSTLYAKGHEPGATP